jgi:AcrR family transcriptional regulator
MPVARKKRPRRSSEEIINLIIEAACDEFERNGYEKAKTAEIARKAGVAEALIFSNFGSKAKLFHDSIFKPLDQLLLQFSSAHPVDMGDAQGMREGTRAYVLAFQEFTRRHSRMLKSLVAAQMFESDNVKGMHQVEGLHAYFVQSSARMASRTANKPKIDPRLLTRISFAAILSCVLFKDWLFPKGLASEAVISAAISSFVAEGLNADADAIPKTRSAVRSQRVSSKKPVKSTAIPRQKR